MMSKETIKKFFSKDSASGENIRTFAIAIVLVMLIRSSIAAPYKIPTGSMIPTLKIGDHIFVSKLSYGLKLPFTNYNLTTWDRPGRGDIIVFRYPEDPSKDYIKRVIGIPGDRVEIRDGVLHVNGDAVMRVEQNQSRLQDQVEAAAGYPEEFALFEEQLGDVKHYILHNRYLMNLLKEFGPIEVDPGHYFVMGDNRDNSKDSRSWGLVPFKNIRGRALAVFFSVKGWPFDIRWRRFGTVVK